MRTRPFLMIVLAVAGMWVSGPLYATVQTAVDWDALTPAEAAPGELIITYRDERARGLRRRALPTPARAQALHTLSRATVRRRYRTVFAEHVTLPPGASMRAVAAAYAALPEVLAVEPNYRRLPTATETRPNDPDYPTVWGMERIDAPEFWTRWTGGGDITVGIIDGGIPAEHEDLKANIWVNPGEDLNSDGVITPDEVNGIDDDSNGYIDDFHGWDFVQNDNDMTPGGADFGHGTHVAGTVGAVGNNATGLVGVCWSVKLASLRIFGPDDAGAYDADIIEAIEYATTTPQIRLTNNSYGGGPPSVATEQAIIANRDAGKLFIAAAGNDGTNNDLIPQYPCGYDVENVISVAAIDVTGALAGFSNFGVTSVDIAAPGVDINSTMPPNGYGSMSGTSMASPHVAGAAALLWGFYSNATFADIRSALLLGAAPNNNVATEVSSGGELNLVAAARVLSGIIYEPGDMQEFSGLPGGPFYPLALTNLISNVSSTNILWSIHNSAPWMTLTPGSGELLALSSTELVYAINAVADTLPRGTYTNVMTLSNLSDTNSSDIVREFRLHVTEPYAFESIDYEWIDPETPGLPRQLLTEAHFGTVGFDLPFDVVYGGRQRRQLYVSKYGAVGFSPHVSVITGQNGDLPVIGLPEPLLFPYWDELNVAEATVTLNRDELSSPKRMIVTWRNARHAADLTAVYDFQAVILENTGGSSDVQFHYRQVSQDRPLGCGRSATVGLQEGLDGGAFATAVAPLQGAAVTQEEWDALPAGAAVPGEFLVMYRGAGADSGSRRVREAPPSVRALHRRHNVTVRRRFKTIYGELIHCPEGSKLAAIVADYRADPEVVVVEPNYLHYRSATIPNDPDFNQLWGMTRIDAPAAWDYGTDAPDIVVAIIDSGIDRFHEDLAANTWVNPGEDLNSDGVITLDEVNGLDDDGNGYIDDFYGWDFAEGDNEPTPPAAQGPQDGSQHGTHVAGSVGAVGNNSTGVVGVCWDVALAALKIFPDAGGGAATADIIAAVEYATAMPQMRVSNNSYGGPSYAVTLRAAIQANADAGKLFVAAAGNSGSNNDVIPQYPASYDVANIVSVAALDVDGTLADFSCYGKTAVDLAAPGVAILSTTGYDTGYESWRGTSMASPYVAGAAAWLWSRFPDVGALTIRAALELGAEPNANLTAFVKTGAELDLMGAFDLLTAQQGVPTAVYAVEGVSTNGTMWLANEQGLLFTGARIPDTEAPFMESAAMVEFLPGFMRVELRFNEVVLGLTASDLLLGGTLSGSYSVTALYGGGERFLVDVEGPEAHGSVLVKVPAAVCTDLAGNPNVGYDGVYAVTPVRRVDFSDDMESGPALWTKTSLELAGFTGVAWEYGVPTYAGGPAQAASVSNCWGTLLDGAYGPLVNASLQMQRVYVGRYPVLEYDIWYDLADDDAQGYVEVNRGHGWENVTPWGGYVGSMPTWSHETIALPPEYARQAVDVRFRMVTGDESAELSAGMYVDNAQVHSLRDQGLWVVDVDPTSLAVSTTQTLSVSLFNGTVNTYDNVIGSASVADSGVDVAAPGAVRYGSMLPGVVITKDPAYEIAVGAPAALVSDRAQLLQVITADERFKNSQSIDLTLLGADGALASSRFRAQALGTVIDWLGRPIMGDGSGASAVYQIIDAGPDGVVGLPSSDGQVSGDDMLLYTYWARQGYGRFGQARVSANLGNFDWLFGHESPGGRKLVARAWDGDSFVRSVAYGDSSAYALTSAQTQTNDFGSWLVDVPADYLRDINHDTVPDGWYVLYGGDPRLGWLPLPNAWTMQSAVQNSMSAPASVAVWNDLVFIADSGGNRVQVWDATLSTLKYQTDFSSAPCGRLNNLQGLTVDETHGRLVIADTRNRRGIVATINPTTGALTYLLKFPAVQTGLPTDPGQFREPLDVAVAADGTIYVADRLTSSPAASRVEVFAAAGGYLREFMLPAGTTAQGLCMGSGDASLYIADLTGHQILEVATASGTLLSSFGSAGTALGSLKGPADVGVGVDGRFYVVERDNHRVQIFAADGTGLAVYPTEALTGTFYGSAPGQLNKPTGLFPILSQKHLVYVADTSNDRVQLLQLELDLDGDGMDDVWESVNGLDPDDPSDAWDDDDGDGVSNLGEFRTCGDPQDPDTNANGASDLWDLQNRNRPCAEGVTVSPPRVTITSNATGPLVAGDDVLITATFSEAIAAASTVRVALEGGAWLFPQTMTRISATVYTYTYTLLAEDDGWVDVEVSGAQDLSGLTLDPEPTRAEDLFEAGVADFLILSILTHPFTLTWEAVAGGVYDVEASPDLIVPVWTNVAQVVAPADGVAGYTNGVLAAPQLFFRVVREVGGTP